MKVLVIDTEGYINSNLRVGGWDNEKSNHDQKLFLLTLLLSSYFILNS
jgi:hypothetical protein